MREELLKGLTEEQIAKVKTCKSSEEVLALAKAEGVKLTDEQLEAVSGGGCGSGHDSGPESVRLICPICGSDRIKIQPWMSNDEYQMHCQKCNELWYGTLDEYKYKG